MKNSINYNCIDIMKFICSILVVIIHAPPLHSFSETANFILVDIVARIAVPFFFVCAGYFFFNKISLKDWKINKIDNNKPFKAYIFHLIKLYSFWTVFYLIWLIPLWYNNGNLTVANLKGYILSIFLSGSFYHLWYVVALFYGLVFAYFLLKYLNVQLVIVTAVIFYIIGTVQYSYSWIFTQNYYFQLFDKTYSFFGAVSVGIFRAFPYLIMGLVFSKFQIKLKTALSTILSLVCFILISLEVGLLYSSGNSMRFSNVFFTGIAVFFIFNTISQIEIRTNVIYPKLRKMSSIIYFIHPMFINISGLILPQYFNNSNSAFLFITVLIYTLFFSLGLIKLSQTKHANYLRIMY